MADTFDFETDEPKSQTGQFIAAGALALLLVVLNVWPDGEEDKPADQTVSPVAVTSADTTAAKIVKRKIEWPQMLLDDVIRTNPFQMSKDLEEARAAADKSGNADAAVAETADSNDRQQPPVEKVPPLDVSRYPISFIFHGPQGPAVMIRDTVYYEGDEIDGMQIVRITKDGVTLRGFPVVANAK